VGDQIPVVDLAKLGEKLPVKDKGKASVETGSLSIAHFMPVTMEKDQVIVGKPVKLVATKEVSDLKYDIIDGAIYVEWSWPDGIDRVVAVHRFDWYPESVDDRDATSIVITKKQYDNHSAFIFSGPMAKDYYLKVFTVCGTGDEIVHSQGVKLLVTGSDPVPVHYEIKVTRNLLRGPKTAELVLSSKQQVSLPQLVLCKKAATLPTRKSDGTPIFAVRPRIILEGGEVTRTINERHLEKDSYGRLFFEDPQDAKRIRLVLPAKEKLRLF
jgi:hypothetical protein